MTLMEVLADDNFISVNRSIVKALGLECAVILGELCSEYTYWKNKGELKNDMFYCTVEKLKERTTLSKYQQLQAIDKLEKIGIVKTELHGVPATRYFKIDQLQLSNFLTSDSCLKTGQLDVQKLDSSNTSNNIQDIKDTFTNVKVEQPSVTPKTSHDNSSKLPKRIPLIKPNIVRESINNSSNIDSSKENKKENESILNKGVVSPIKKKNLYEKCIDKIYEFTDDVEIRERLIEYLGVRLERKDIEFGSKGFEGMLKRLKRTSSDKEEQLAIIQQAIDRNYPTFYPLSKYTKQNKDVFSEYGKVKSIHKDEEIVNVSF